MIDFAKLLPDFYIFYNGPKCGASAPDHMHFQAYKKGQLPFEEDSDKVEKRILSENKFGEILELLDFGRKCFVIESGNKQEIISMFKQLYIQLQMFTLTNEEPLMNIFTKFDNNKWSVYIFARKTHRPKQFYSNGDDYLMISPGAVDIAGLFVLPRKEDFEADAICF